MRKTSSNRVQLCASLALILLFGPAGAAGAVGLPDPLFASDDVLEVTLSGDLKGLARDRKEVPELRPGSLSYAGPDGNPVTIAVDLEPRGKSRRQREVCAFPPLWVHMDKDAVQGTLFAKQKRLKMVTYCKPQESFQDYVLKEYLAYRIFNLLSEESFRVRLLRVHFSDAGTKKELVRYAFFIEHKDRLGKRLDARVVEPDERIPVASLEPEQATIGGLYQFMVSNTDYSFIAPPVDDSCCHNTVLLQKAGDEGSADGEGVVYRPIPYDFDRTGFVDPPNGEPAAELGQRSFRDRVYRGFCRDSAYLDAAIEKTRAARGAIEDLVRSQAGLSERSRDRALAFLASYYDLLADPKRREEALKCRSLS